MQQYVVVVHYLVEERCAAIDVMDVVAHIHDELDAALRMAWCHTSENALGA